MANETNILQIGGIELELADRRAREVIGDTAGLDTASKANLVAAINEVAAKVGTGGSGTGGGAPGESAYEIAVRHGFVGSEAAWLESLNGTDCAPVERVEPAEDDLPRMYFTLDGWLPTTKNAGEVRCGMRYASKTADFSYPVTMKVQGGSSASDQSYKKKNYTMKVFSDDTYASKKKLTFKGWPGMNKFVLKASWVTPSHIRNPGTAEIAGQVVRSRSDYGGLPEELRSSPNQGATDGFAVRVWVNGLYWGIYELIVAKDKLFGQDSDNTAHSIVGTEWNNQPSCAFSTTTPTINGNWEEELQDSMTAETKASLENLIRFVAGSDDGEFIANAETYFDVQSVIDADIMFRLFCVVDNLCRNQIFFKYGTKWYEGFWDLDAVLGLPPVAGQTWFRYDTPFQSGYVAHKDHNVTNRLYERVEELFPERFKARYWELRGGVLSVANVLNVYERRMDVLKSYDGLLAEDYASTTGNGQFTAMPNTATDTIQQIRKFVHDRWAYMDGVIAAMGTTVSCTGITLSAGALSFEGVESKMLTATVTPAGCTDTVVWSSGNTNVATVTGGMVRSKANGNAVITATCGGHSASCTVTVTGIEAGDGNEVTVDIVSESNQFEPGKRLSGGIAIGGAGYENWVCSPIIPVTGFPFPFTVHIEGTNVLPETHGGYNRISTYAADPTDPGNKLNTYCSRSELPTLLNVSAENILVDESGNASITFTETVTRVDGTEVVSIRFSSAVGVEPYRCYVTYTDGGGGGGDSGGDTGGSGEGDSGSGEGGSGGGEAEHGANLIEGIAFENAYINYLSGVYKVVPNTDPGKGYRISAFEDYIPVIPGKRYEATADNTNAGGKAYFKPAFYGADKTFVPMNYELAFECPFSIVVPDGVYFLRGQFSTCPDQTNEDGTTNKEPWENITNRSIREVDISPNLIEGVTMTNGVVNWENGTFTPFRANWPDYGKRCSAFEDYIPVESGKTYVATATNNGGGKAYFKPAFYYSEGQFKQMSYAEAFECPYEFTIPVEDPSITLLRGHFSTVPDVNNEDGTENVEPWTNITNKSICEVIDTEIPCTGITLIQHSLDITGAGSRIVTAAVEPEDCTETVTWTSSNTSVATVSLGIVTAVGNGNAVITVTCGEYSEQCIVSVTGTGIGAAGTNLLDGFVWRNGMIDPNTGAYLSYDGTPSAGLRRAAFEEYIPVAPGDKYLATAVNSGGGNAYFHLSLYDSQKRFIPKGLGNIALTCPQEINIAAGTAYIRGFFATCPGTEGNNEPWTNITGMSIVKVVE